MKIVVDRGKCIAVTNCVGLAPLVFRLDAMRKAVVMDPHGADDASIMEAARSCPTEAIALYDEATGERVEI